MYKVIIVDDEAIIRNGIKSIIPWNDLEVEEVLLAESGEKALNLIQSNPVDLILTDICMINMDGLQLIENLKAIHNDIRIIVLTGYDNFEYAKQCCRLEVHDFLLKPIDENDLTNAIKKQLDVIKEKEKLSETNRIMSRATGTMDQMRIEQVMKKLILNQALAEDIINLCSEFHYLRSQRMQLVIILPIVEKLKEWENYHSLLHLSVKNICISLFDSRKQGITFEDELGRIILSVFDGSEWDEIEKRIRDLKSVLNNELDLPVNMFLGSLVNGFHELNISYHDALSILEVYPNLKNEVFQSEKTEKRLKIFSDTVDEFLKIIENNIDDEDKILKVFDAYERCTKSYDLNDTMLRKTTFQIISYLYYEYLVDTKENPDDMLNSIINEIISSKKDDIFEISREFIKHLFSLGQRKDEHELVRRAKQYINEHLGDNLSVTSLSDELFVSTNYFSRLFKKETGEGCNEYIVNKRLEKAKNLLDTTSIKSGKIAFMVGYKDINYFSLAFKKSTGMSPTEYREKRRNDTGIE